MPHGCDFHLRSLNPLVSVTRSLAGLGYYTDNFIILNNNNMGTVLIGYYIMR